MIKTEDTNMSNTTIMPGDQAISLPIDLLRDGRLTPEVVGALALGLAYQDDPEAPPLPRLLQQVGRMRKTRAIRVTDTLLALGYAKREQQAGVKGRKGFGPMRYRFFLDPQPSG
jgi:hypothetical protein